MRPETIGVSLDDAGGHKVTVRNFEQPGFVTHIYAAFENGENQTVQLGQQIPLQRGQSIGVTLHTADFHIFGGEGEVALSMEAK